MSFSDWLVVLEMKLIIPEEPDIEDLKEFVIRQIVRQHGYLDFQPPRRGEKT